MVNILPLNFFVLIVSYLILIYVLSRSTDFQRVIQLWLEGLHIIIVAGNCGFCCLRCNVVTPFISSGFSMILIWPHCLAANFLVYVAAVALCWTCRLIFPCCLFFMNVVYVASVALCRTCRSIFRCWLFFMNVVYVAAVALFRTCRSISRCCLFFMNVVYVDPVALRRTCRLIFRCCCFVMN